MIEENEFSNERHGFNPHIAKIYGINEALLYQHIGYCATKNPTHSTSMTLDYLCRRFWYLGAKQVRLALKNISVSCRKHTALLIRNRNGCSYSYAPIAEFSLNQKKHWFDTELAARFGSVETAVIYDNITYWIKDNWEKKCVEVKAKLDPRKFDSLYNLEVFAYAYTKPASAHFGKVYDWVNAFHEYVPLRTAERSFQTLVRTGMLKVRHTGNRTPVWSLPRKETLEFLDKQLKIMGFSLCPEDVTAKRASSPPKGQGHRQKGKLTAKRAEKQELTTALSITYDAFESLLESSVVEANSRNLTSSQPVSPLADARGDSPVEIEVDKHPAYFSLEMTQKEIKRVISTFSPETAKAISNLNKPTLPRERPPLTDEDGKLIKRRYVRKPVALHNPDWDEGEGEFFAAFEERFRS